MSRGTKAVIAGNAIMWATLGLTHVGGAGHYVTFWAGACSGALALVVFRKGGAA